MEEQLPSFLASTPHVCSRMAAHVHGPCPEAPPSLHEEPGPCFPGGLLSLLGGTGEQHSGLLVWGKWPYFDQSSQSWKVTLLQSDN